MKKLREYKKNKKIAQYKEKSNIKQETKNKYNILKDHRWKYEGKDKEDSSIDYFTDIKNIPRNNDSDQNNQQNNERKETIDISNKFEQSEQSKIASSKPKSKQRMRIISEPNSSFFEKRNQSTK